MGKTTKSYWKKNYCLTIIKIISNSDLYKHGKVLIKKNNKPKKKIMKQKQSQKPQKGNK